MKRILFIITSLIVANQLYSQNQDKFWEAMYNDQYHEALSEVNLLLARNPKSSSLYYMRSCAYDALGQHRDELNDLTKAIKYWSKQDTISLANLYGLRAYTYILLGDSVRALKDYSSAIKIDPQEVDYYQERASIYVSSGKYSKAEAEYERALTVNPHDFLTEFLYVDCLLKQEKTDEATLRVENLIKFNPQEAGPRRLMSEICFWKDDVQCCIDNYVEFMDLADFPDTELFILYCMLDYDYAVARINEKIQTSPDTVFWLITLANLEIKTDRYEEAIAHLKNIPVNETDTSNFLLVNYNLAICHISMYEYSQAIPYFTRILEFEEASDAVDYDDYLLRGLCYSRSGETAKAMDDFNNAIDHTVGSSIYYMQRAILNEDIGEHAAARRDYDKAIELDDDNDCSIWLRRGKHSLLKLNDPASARNDFMHVVTYDTLYTEGTVREQALHFLGRDDEAEEWMNGMLGLYPDEKTLLYQATCLFSLTGKLDKAMECLTQALDLGYRNFYHILHDTDIDPLRNRDDFKELVTKYQR